MEILIKICLAFFIAGLGTALAIYLGAWVLFVGGIVQVIEAAKADPVSAIDIAVGALRIVCAGPVGWFTFIFGIFVASEIL